MVYLYNIAKEITVCFPDWEVHANYMHAMCLSRILYILSFLFSQRIRIHFVHGFQGFWIDFKRIVGLHNFGIVYHF